MTAALTPISDFDGDGTVYRFFASVSGPHPELVIEADSGQHVTRLTLGSADLGNFAHYTEEARKELLRLWVARA
jgi:hypothetical protein